MSKEAVIALLEERYGRRAATRLTDGLCRVGYMEQGVFQVIGEGDSWRLAAEAAHLVPKRQERRSA